MKKLTLLITICGACFGISFSKATSQTSNSSFEIISASKPRILVFTKTKGYYHRSIPFGVAAIIQLGKENNFSVDSTSNAGYFIEGTLKNYAGVIFLSTTGDVLNSDQQVAFERYIRAGGGFVGVHSATDTEYDWPWYNKLIGAYFANHPKLQNATINIIDKYHPSTYFLPNKWQRFDEWYNFKNVQPDIKILANLDETSYEGGTMGAKHPIAWYHDYDGGRAFYTAGGHTKESYTETLFLRHLLGGIKYVIGKNDPPVVKITNPRNNAVYYAHATIQITATASDTDGTIKTVKFYNGSILFKTDSTSPYTYTWSNVAAGTYYLKAKAIDNFGLSSTSAIVKISVLPNTAPVVSITSPANNAVFYAPANINIHASATDADGTITNVKFYNGTTLLKTDSTSPYSLTWSKVAAGNYSLTAKAMDNRGGIATSAIVKISVLPNKAPVVKITAPVNNAVYTAPANINIAAAASDSDGTIKSVKLYNGTTLLKTDSTSPYTYSWGSIPEGSYSLTAKATDNHGLTTTSATVKVIVVTDQAPVVNITSPANNAVYSAPTNIPLVASAKDADGTINKVQFYNGNSLMGTQYLSPYSFDWKDVPPGTYTLTAKAIDNLGLAATSAPVKVTVTAQNLMIVGNKPASGINKTSLNNVISLNLYPNPAGDILNIYTKELMLNKQTIISIISVSGIVVKKMQMNRLSPPFPLNVSALAKGVYTIKLISGEKVIYKQFVKL